MNTELDKSKMEKKPTWQISLIPFVVLISLMALVVRFFGSDALDGGSQVALLASSAVCVAIAIWVFRVPWHRIEEAIGGNIKAIGSAIIILLLIGAISGSWMISGIVPTLICYGLQVIRPEIFLVASCVICALVSIMTGSSWTTIATLGVALMGIGSALGFSAGLTAGAIISGAYFGDKISPLSDTTVMASSTAGAPLFVHIKYMMLTTVPSFVITLIIFSILSLVVGESSSAAHAGEISEQLRSSFNISPWLLLVPVFTAYLIAKKLPAIITLFLASLMAGITALIAQPGIVAEIGSGVSGAELDFAAGFRGICISFYGATSVQTGSEMLDSLVATRGMGGMLQTIFLIVCATTFGGALSGSGMIQSLTEELTRRLKKRFSVVTGTVCTGVVSNMLTGDQYLSIILTSSLFKNLFDKEGYEPRLLSRSVEDSATVTSVLVPWNSCGMTQATVLHVSTLTYLPFCFFNLISPFMSMFMALIGWKIYKRSDKVADKMELADNL